MAITYIDLQPNTTLFKWNCSLNTQLMLDCHSISIPIQTDIFGSFVYLYTNNKEKFYILSDKVLASSILPIGVNDKENFYIASPINITLDKTINLSGIEYLSIIDGAELKHTIPLASNYQFYINDFASLSNVRFRILGEIDNKLLDNIDNMTLSDLDYITIE